MKRRLIGTIASLAIAALALGGCASPAALGITGPGTAPGGASARPAADDAALPSATGVSPDAGATYAPSMVPTFGTSGRYYGNQY